MPNQNNTDPNKSNSIPVVGQVLQPPPVFPQADLPPLPPDFQNVEPEKTDVPPVEKTSPPANQSSVTVNVSGSAAPASTLPPIIPPAPKKKFGGGRVIATILGILLLVGGVGAGLLLTQQQQLFQPKARVAQCISDDDCASGNCSGGQCQGQGGAGASGGDAQGCECGVNNKGECIACAPPPPPPPAACTKSCVNSRECSDGGGSQITGACSNGNVCCSFPSSAGSTGGGVDSCGSSATCNNYAGGTGCENAGGTIDSCTTSGGSQGNCCVPISPPGTQVPAGNCADNPKEANACFVKSGIGVSTKTGEVCDDLGHWTTCASGYHCDTTAQDCLPNTSVGGGGTPPPSGPSAQCVGVTAYSSTWTALTPANLSALTAGTVVNFCVAGSASTSTFDKAQFKINATLGSEITTKGSGAAADKFCQSYTILPTDTTVNVKAKIHHTTLGYYGEAI